MEIINVNSGQYFIRIAGPQIRFLPEGLTFCPLNVNWESFFDRSKSLCRNK